jgi:hypothetical protein
MRSSSRWSGKTASNDRGRTSHRPDMKRRPCPHYFEVAATLAIRFRGTLGVLLDAKQVGLVSTITPLLDQLQALGFHLSSRTREVILDLAGEAP